MSSFVGRRIFVRSPPSRPTRIALLLSITNSRRRCIHSCSHSLQAYGSLNDSPKVGHRNTENNNHFDIPKRQKQKITSAEDAVSLIRNGDTVAVSGFVCQGAPEAVLRALGARYEAEGAPYDLSLVFGGGPGTWNQRM
jgi:hypothetical protein